MTIHNQGTIYTVGIAVTSLQASSVKTCQHSMWLASHMGRDRRYNSRVTLREIATDWVTERWTIEGRLACLYSSLNVQSSHNKIWAGQPRSVKTELWHRYKGWLKIEAGTSVWKDNFMPLVVRSCSSWKDSSLGCTLIIPSLESPNEDVSVWLTDTC